MSNLRNTEDIIKEVLKKAGELQDGNSPFHDTALEYINSSYQDLLAGGSEFGTDVDEVWSWARASQPLLLQLLPAYEDGSVTVTQDSLDGTFSSTPTESQEGRFLKVNGETDYYVILQHNAGEATFQLDQPYISDSGSFQYRSIKLDYDLKYDFVTVTDGNRYVDFVESGGTYVAVLDKGVYSFADFQTELKTKLEAAGADTYTVSFNEVTRRFNVLSDGSFLSLLNGSGVNSYRALLPTVGYRQEDLTGALTYSGINAVNAIMRFVQPLTNYKNTQLNVRYFAGSQEYYRRHYSHDNETGEGKIFGIDMNVLLREYPMTSLAEGAPTKFAVKKEHDNGTQTVRFNRSPREDMRVEVSYIPYWNDLEDNTNSVPCVPRAYRDFLVYAATYKLLIDKSDNKAQTYFTLAEKKLVALVNNERTELHKSGRDYGRIIPRRDNQ